MSRIDRVDVAVGAPPHHSELPSLCITPQLLQLVELARGRVEDVNDEVDVIDQDPLSTLQALHMVRSNALFLQLVQDVIGDRLDLNVGGAGGDQEIVRCGGDAPEIEGNDVVSLPLQRQLGGALQNGNGVGRRGRASPALLR